MWILVGPNCASLHVYNFKGNLVTPEAAQCKRFLEQYVSTVESDITYATGCGVVPTRYAHLADWTIGDMHAADGNYFNRLSEQLPRTYLVKKLIYMYTGAHKGSDVNEA